MAAEKVVDTFVTRFLFRTDAAALGALDRRIGRMRQRLDGMSRGFSIAGGLITGALIGTAKPLDAFSKSTNRLERDLALNNEQMAIFKRQQIEIGNSSRYTTIGMEDVAVAQRELGKAGLDLNEVLAMTPIIMDVVAATEMEVADAAQRGASLLAAYGREVGDLESIFDKMAWTAVNANTTFDQLLNGMLRIGPIADAFGADAEEMIAVMATLNSIKIDPERASTGLRTFMIILASLDTLTGDAKAKLEDLGVSVDRMKFLKAQGRILPIVDELRRAGADLETISLVFGREAADVVTGLMNNTGTAAELLAEAATKSFGQVERQAIIMNKGVSGALAAMKSSAETAIVALGDAGVNDTLKQLAGLARSVTEGFIGLDKETQGYIATALAMGPVMLGIGGLLKGVSFLLGGLVPIIKLVAGTWKVWSLLFLGNPIVAGIAAVAAGLFTLWWNWDEIARRMEGTWLGDFLSGKAGTEGGETMERLKGYLATLWDGVKDNAIDAFDVIDDWLKQWTDKAVDKLVNIKVGESPVDEVMSELHSLDVWFNEKLMEWGRAGVEWLANLPWGMALEFFKRGFADIAAYVAGLVTETDWIGLLFPSIRRYQENRMGQPEGPELPPDHPMHPDRQSLWEWMGGGLPQGAPGVAMHNLVSGPLPQPGPVMPSTPGAGGPAAGKVSRQITVNVQEGAVVVNTQSTDPDQITEMVGSKLTEQMHDAAENWETGDDR